jgi:hypothetical protein
MAFKMKHSSPLNMINKGKGDNTKKGGRMSEKEASAAKPDMEVTITAKQKTVKAGEAMPSSDVSKGRKVKEIKKKRTFGDVALSKKEKMSAKGAKFAKTKTVSVENVKFK